ncbi:MAG: type II secretion system protein [Anaerofustis sp.]
MNKGRNPALIELIIVIFFFSLSATVIVQLFMASHDYSMQSRLDGNILVATQDWMEQLRNNPSSADEIFPNWQKMQENGQIVYKQYFSADMSVSAESDADLIVVTGVRRETLGYGDLAELSITVYSKTIQQSNELTSLTSSVYVPASEEKDEK